MNKKPGENRHLNSVKGTIACPFFSRQGWCVKGSRCEFKHPRDKRKRWVPCPFLQKRGFCPNNTRCDFSHSANPPYNSRYNIPSSRPVNIYPAPSLPLYHLPPMASQVKTYGIGVSQCLQSYTQRTGLLQIHPKPLMEIPVHPPLPKAFRDLFYWHRTPEIGHR